MITASMQEVQRVTFHCAASPEEKRRIYKYCEDANMTIVRSGPPLFEDGDIRVDLTRFEVVAEMVGPKRQLAVNA